MAATSSKARTIAVTALFTAASLVLSFVQIPIFPMAPWLMYDPSAIVCLVAALVFGPRIGCAVAVVSWIPRIFLDPFGAPMGILASCALIAPAGIVFARDRTRGGATIGMVMGALLSISLTCLANLYITPLYAGIGTAEVALMIAPAILPFNLIKSAINIAVAQAAFSPVMRLFEARGYLPRPVADAAPAASGGSARETADPEADSAARSL